MGETCPKLLDLISKDREKKWVVNNSNNNRDEGEEKIHVCECGSESDESNKLELRLGLPGGDDGWSDPKTIKTKNNPTLRNKQESQLLSLGYFSPSKQEIQDQKQAGLPGITVKPPVSPFHHYQTGPRGLPAVPKDPSQPCSTRFSPASANTAVPNSSQKRAAPASVVGWPPVRSCRKNLASTSSAKLVSESPSTIPSPLVNKKAGDEKSNKGLFVKINMDGVPIGRKVDLSAYDSYERLSSAVDELFRGLLAAQRDCCGSSNERQEEQKPITGVLDGSGEYTLVYEDDEGDRVLVVDVPWPMFLSTVKRLWVLKSSDSDLSKLTRGESKEVKAAMADASSK